MKNEVVLNKFVLDQFCHKLDLENMTLALAMKPENTPTSVKHSEKKSAKAFAQREDKPTAGETKQEEKEVKALSKEYKKDVKSDFESAGQIAHQAKLTAQKETTAAIAEGKAKINAAGNEIAAAEKEASDKIAAASKRQVMIRQRILSQPQQSNNRLMLIIKMPQKLRRHRVRKRRLREKLL